MSNENKKEKVAIYCRLSEEDKNKTTSHDDSNSIQNQKTMLIQYALAQGWEIYNIYSDDDYAGADRRRPEFNRLLQAAEQQQFDIVLCKTQSRFTRELELVEKYIHGLFPIWGIRFISIVDNADTANKGNKKSRQINGLVNEWYLEDMSENIRSVLTNRRQNGFHIGSFALYGYRKDPKQKGHLLIDEEAASIVREIFTLFSQGYGKTAIARILNDRGIPNPTEYKRLHGLRYQPAQSPNSTLWQYGTIANMLVNEIYIGNMVQGKYGSVSYKTKQNKPRPKSKWYRVEGTHEAIIEQELWESVQTLIAQKAKPFNSGCIGLFARKARCANCGAMMHSCKSHQKHYLQCASRHVAKDTCSGAFIAVDKLESLVLDELNRLAAIYLDQEALIRHITSSSDSHKRKEQLSADLLRYQKEIARYSQNIYQLYCDKLKGLLSESDFVEMNKQFCNERNRLQYMRTSKEQQLAELNNPLKNSSDIGKQLEQYVPLRHLNREIVETLIDYISIGKRIPGSQDVPIEIHWNF